jgi:hypothetical protein
MESEKTLQEQIEKEAMAAVAEAPASLAQRVEKTRPRQKSYVMDLRIHSPASLGYLGIEGIDTAPALVRLARVKGLDVIAVTDFYSGDYIDRIINAARESTITVIPGVVIRCTLGACDDVILSCLFPESYSSKHIQDFLQRLSIPPAASGDRHYVVKAPFNEILKAVEESQGIALPSRMDKTPFRMTAVPALVNEHGFRAFDLAYPDSARFFKTHWPKIKFQLFSFSNANALAQVGSRIAKIKMQEPGFTGLRQIVARAGKTSPLAAEIETVRR